MHPGTEGRAFREAWVAGVKRHYPGVPKDSYVADWTSCPRGSRRPMPTFSSASNRMRGEHVQAVSQAAVSAGRNSPSSLPLAQTTRRYPRGSGTGSEPRLTAHADP
jgi:hypothetical protein